VGPRQQELQEYLYLSGRDTDNALLEMNGLVKTKETNDGFKMTICPRCNTNNSPGSKFCNNCSLGLDTKTITEFEQTKEDLTSNVINLIKDKEQALQTLKSSLNF